MLVVDLFSRHAEGYALSADEKPTQGCAAKLVLHYIPRWGCPHTFLSDRGPEFESTVCREIFRMLGAVKRVTSSAHAQTNGMVARLNHTLCQILSHLIANNQTNWDELLLHAIAAHNNSVSRGTGLAPNEVRIGPKTTNDNFGRTWSQGSSRTQTRPVRFSPTHAREAEQGVRASEDRRFLDQGEAPGC